MTEQVYYCPYLYYSISEENAKKCYSRSGERCKHAKSSCLIHFLSTSQTHLETSSQNLVNVGIETDPSSGNPVPYVRPAQSQTKCTTVNADGSSSENPGNWIPRDGGGEAFVRDLPQDRGPLGKPSYEKRDDPSLRSKAIKKY